MLSLCHKCDHHSRSEIPTLAAWWAENRGCCCPLIKLFMVKHLHISPSCCLSILQPGPCDQRRKILRVTRCRLEGFGRRWFTYAAPSLLEPLPTPVKRAFTIDTFKSSLKTYLLNLAYPSFHWLFYCISILFVSLLVFSTYKRFCAWWHLTILEISAIYL